MTIPNSIADLSTTQLDNSPQGSESLSIVDNHLRAHAALLKSQSVIATATFNNGVVTIGLSAGQYTVTPTADITSLVGGFTDGVFTLIFLNTTPYTISNSSTISSPTLVLKKYDSITVTKAGNGVFTVIETNTSEQLDDFIETANGELDDINSTLTSHTNSLNTLSNDVAKRNQIAWGYTDGNGYYGDQYVSNMSNVLLHTAINIPPGVWEVTGYSAMVFNDSVSASFPIGLMRADNTNIGVATPAVFAHFKGDGGVYMPVHFKAIVSNETGTDQNYRLKCGAVQFVGPSRQSHGLFGSSIGETKLYAIRLY